MSNFNTGDKVYTIGDIDRLERENAELKSQVESLRSAINANVIDLVRCGIGGNFGGSCYEKAMADYYEPLAKAFMRSPAQCLAEVKAQAVEDFREWMRINKRYTFAIELCGDYANQLRQQESK